MIRPPDIPEEVWEFAGKLSKLPPAEQLTMLNNFMAARPRKAETVALAADLRTAIRKAMI